MNGMDRFDAPAWWTAVATVLSYVVVLLVFAALLFGGAFLVFSVL